ncbi:pyridoxamine 5'-phosphate oxidase family protein (plasmid) [Haloferacaceae archaeon DSL9]
MEGLRWITLSDEERDEFLGNGGTGVISFATSTDEPPFSLPVSYGYYADLETFYFQFAFLPDSGKEGAVDEPVTFVVHADTDEGWRSVVATGDLEEVTDAPYESIAVQGLWGVDIPQIDIFERPPEELTYRTFRLVPDRVTGRKQVQSDRDR